MKIIAAVFCCALSFGSYAQEPQWTGPPKLVVGIVVDQMRVDFIYRYWDNFGDGGFRRLVREGSFQRDAHYNYVPTQTAPGHASIYTGTTPSRHGIITNWPYNRDTRHSYYIARDTSVAPVGTLVRSAQSSPARLLATTLADELELRTGGKSHTVGVALKDRSSIMPMGRMGDEAYWFVGGGEGNFITSSWYRKSLPAWLQAFNAQKLPAAYLNQTWNLLLPRGRYHDPLPDHNAFEEDWADGIAATLPLDLRSLYKAGKNLDLVKQTPWGNTLTTDLAIAAITGDSLGGDSVPDLLSVSYSSTDELQHAMGPRALEVEDTYLRLDADLARLLKHLDETVGVGGYTVFLAADHGGGDVPSWLRSMKASAGYTYMDDVREFLVQKGFGTVIDTILNDQVFLKGNVPAGTAKAVASALNEYPAIAYAASADQLLEYANGPGLAQAMANGLMRQRSGDVLFALRPGFFRGHRGWKEQGADHATAWNYDTQVPVLFFGKGVAAGEILRRTSITDIAPTVCAILGMALPNAADGAVVPEVLARP
jgi:predicted AlkP superfamily pyrophosphatase or phosphodiesterase